MTEQRTSERIKTAVMQPRLLKTKHAARYLGMSPWALRQLVSSGDIPFISSGDRTSSWKFDIRDLDAWIERRRITF
jgi:excisionase family DNA binding protein